MRISDWSSDVCSSDLWRRFIADLNSREISPRHFGAAYGYRRLTKASPAATSAGMDGDDATAIDALSFEDALKRLEAIVHRLEAGEAGLEDRKSTRLNSSH